MITPRWISMLVTSALWASVATAQAPAHRRELVGIVRDAAGAGIEGANVEIPGAAVGTNPKGTFQLWTGDIDTVTISIRRLGYLPVSAQLLARGGRWDTVVVEMERTSQRLSAVTVSGSPIRRGLGLRDFDARRSIGNGIFVAREEITARNFTKRSRAFRSNSRRRAAAYRAVRLSSGHGFRERHKRLCTRKL